MPQATITIKAVTPKKSGETNGKAWTVYEVDAGDRKFSTLDPAWSLYVHDTLTVEYEEQRSGRFTNFRLGEAPAGKPAPPPPAARETDGPSLAASRPGDEKFRTLDATLDQILEMLTAICRHFT